MAEMIRTHRKGDCLVWGRLRAVAVAAVSLAFLFIALVPGFAVEAVNVRSDAMAIDLTTVADRIKTETDRILVSAAPGADGIVRRMQQPAREGSTNWAVFALANTGDEQIDRLIVVPHYRMVGSGVLWPDLGLSRVVTITPSSGERPERQDSATADIFRITLDPGTVITYIDRAVKARVVLEDVQISGDVNDQYKSITADQIQVKRDGQWKTVWSQKMQEDLRQELFKGNK
jgi:hypothetical protein